MKLLLLGFLMLFSFSMFADGIDQPSVIEREVGADRTKMDDPILLAPTIIVKSDSEEEGEEDDGDRSGFT